MDLNDLLKSLPDVYSPIDRELISKAYNFAVNAHEGQSRYSGEPYINHCTAVASILAELRVPPVVVAAALLHDTVEDTRVTLVDLKDNFNEEIAKLVDGVTKLTKLPHVGNAEQHIVADSQTDSIPIERQTSLEESQPKNRKKDLAAETLRKTLMAMGDDVRVVLIKLADRLHNMRTLSHIPEENRRRRIAQETMDIFAPLANRLGIWQIKWELEDLALRYTNPTIYKEIAEKLADKRIDREKEVREIIDRLQNLMKDGGINAEISGRPKHIYSIYEKMKKKGKPFENLMDLRAVRLIVPDIPACYAALGLIHTHWRPIPTEFDDYIAAPKDNFYQSLHTAVLYSDGKPLEVQIRTPEMHQNAELGIAAHWLYKEKKALTDNYQQRITWLRKMMEWRQDVDDAQEFVDGIKSDVFEDRVYVFTPRGDIIDLPRGATPIDFAYSVHTEIGNRCRGAKINGKLVTLDYQLKTGDQVEILSAKHGGPSRDWLNPHLGLVNTQRARSKIRQWFKRLDRDQNLAHGKSMLEKEFHRLGIDNVNLDSLVKDFEYKTIDDLYVALGCGDISIKRIINKIQEEEKSRDDLLFNLKTSNIDQKDNNSFRVLGIKGLLTTNARCCNPAPGDQIVGYVTRGRGVTIHRKDCPNILRSTDKERIVQVTWGEAQRTFPVTVQVKAYDRQGLMGDISNILSNDNINMRDIAVKFSNNLASIKLILEISDISQLSRILTLIESLPNVMEAFRVKPG